MMDDGEHARVKHVKLMTSEPFERPVAWEWKRSAFRCFINYLRVSRIVLRCGRVTVPRPIRSFSTARSNSNLCFFSSSSPSYSIDVLCVSVCCNARAKQSISSTLIANKRGADPFVTVRRSTERVVHGA